MKPSIRQARAEDAEFVAWAILTAARSHLPRGWFDIVLDAPEQECLEFLTRLALTESRSWWHYSRFTIGEVDGRLASALCSFRAGDGYPLSQAAMTEVANRLGWGEAAQQTMWQRGAYLFTCLMEPHDDFWTIENVATLPEYRRHGLVCALIDRALNDGRTQGFRRAQINFLIGNDPAERAYAKAGFRFEEERHHPDFEAASGSRGLRRFIRDL